MVLTPLARLVLQLGLFHYESMVGGYKVKKGKKVNGSFYEKIQNSRILFPSGTFTAFGLRGRSFYYDSISQIKFQI